jgi:hypothetical protein
VRKCGRGSNFWSMWQLALRGTVLPHRQNGVHSCGFCSLANENDAQLSRLLGFKQIVLNFVWRIRIGSKKVMGLSGSRSATNFQGPLQLGVEEANEDTACLT